MLYCPRSFVAPVSSYISRLGIRSTQCISEGVCILLEIDVPLQTFTKWPAGKEQTAWYRVSAVAAVYSATSGRCPEVWVGDGSRVWGRPGPSDGSVVAGSPGASQPQNAPKVGPDSRLVVMLTPCHRLVMNGTGTRLSWCLAYWWTLQHRSLTATSWTASRQCWLGCQQCLTQQVSWLVTSRLANPSTDYWGEIHTKLPMCNKLDTGNETLHLFAVWALVY